MRINQTVMLIFGLLGSAGAVPACAQAGDAAGAARVGRIETIYVRVSPDLFIEQKLLRKTAGKELWADVKFAQEPAQEIFRMPAQIVVEGGDLVATQPGDTKLHSMNLLPQDNRVTELVAKRGTLMAMSYGSANAASARGLYAEPSVCSNVTLATASYAGACSIPK
jgi:hypothetical protein